MSEVPEAMTKIRAVAARSQRYKVGAYLFVLAAVNYTVNKHSAEGKRGHVSGQQLAEGIRELAIERFGYLARAVFEEHGVHCTDDFGELVFELIDADLLSREEADRKEHFNGLYDFAEAFERV